MAWALSRLPAPQRDAVRLLDLDGLTQVEAGARLGLSRGRVRGLRDAAHASVRSAFGLIL